MSVVTIYDNGCDPAPPSPLAPALAHVRAGAPVVLVDDAPEYNGSQNAAFLVVAADTVDSATIDRLLREARGMIYLCLTAEQCDALALRATTNDPTRWQAKLMESVDARLLLSSGVGAADRARTIRTALDPRTQPNELVSPGHVFPLRATPGSTLACPEPTECAVDLARLAGRSPAAVISDILDDQGAVADLGYVEGFAAHHGYPILRIADVVKHLCATEHFLELVTEAQMPTSLGVFRVVGVRDIFHGDHHVLLIKDGPMDRSDGVLVAVHVECLLGTALSGLGCNCGAELTASLERIAREGGILVHLTRGGTRALDRGANPFTSCDRYPGAEHRPGFYGNKRSIEYVAAAALREIGVHRIRTVGRWPSAPVAHAFGLEVAG